MALSQRLDLRQSQTLVMTPQLQQAIKLLQLSNIELSSFVEREMEQNPLLDGPDSLADDGEPGQVTNTNLAPEPDATPAERTADLDRLASTETFGSAQEPALDADYGNVWNDEVSPDGEFRADGAGASEGDDGHAYDTGDGWSTVGRGGGFDDDGASWEERVARDGNLRDHLMAQLSVDVTDAGDRLIGASLIDSLDDSGYLTADLGDLAARLGAAEERVMAVLARLQQFEPAGLFARSLAECLALQLRERDRLDPAMQAMLDNLDLLADGDLAGLRTRCGVDDEDLSEMISELRQLDPKPALQFESFVSQTVVPDILMRPNPEGGWLIELNPETLPKVLVNRRYYTQVSQSARSKEEREYLAEQLNSANWLVKSLDQRANTILKVASEIVRQQEAFFRHGIEHLRPLILRDIAEAIGMHESTVSRVTTNKCMATPRAVFELKYFFSTAIPGSGGAAAHSAEAVRHRIKTMIDQEPATAILSDDRIVEILREDGIDIARRTVAKYREMLNIPSSVQRRRQKNRGTR